MMAAPDMEVIKEIPGYKVILKAVLKCQIQQLVEQLASHTEEESVILTASVSDGTLSHLGSDSGKFFLSDHEDIKSQFLGFCLKRHHKKKQEKEREEELQRREEELKRLQSFTPQHMGPRSRFSTPRGQGIPHHVRMSRSHTGPPIRGPPIRHEPYSVPRPRRANLNQSVASPGLISPGSGIVKIEPQDEESNQSAGDTPNTPKQTENNSSQPTSPSSVMSATVAKSDIDEDSSSAISKEFGDTQPPEGLGLDSDFSKLIAEEQSTNPETSTSATDNSELDPNVNVKLEAISEGDMELEITGVEPGRAPPVSSQMDTSWGSNTSMGYDQSGAMGGPSDMPGQEGSYNVDGPYGLYTLYTLGTSNSNTGLNSKPEHKCDICGKIYSCASSLRRHMRVHTGVKAFRCGYCQYKTSRKDHLTTHMMIQHLKSFKCD